MALVPGSSASPFSGQQRLSRNQKMLMGIVGVSSMLEFWDAYLIGFVMGYLVKPWGLNYGVMGTVLLASGIGAIVGGVVWGALADLYGRKPVFVGSMLLTALSSFALAFTPDHDWLYMAVLRVIMGFGTGGFFIQIGWIQEFIPPRRRGMLTGIVSMITTGGLLLGALCGAVLIPAIGWRATFAMGALPGVIAIVAMFVVPESPRWLLLQGRGDAARRAIAWGRGCSIEEAGDILPPVPVVHRANWFELFRFPRNVLTTALVNLGLIAGYYGIVLWSPTLLAQVQGIGAGQASQIMIAFSLCGAVARLAAAYAADAVGRRLAGGCFALAAAVFTFLAGLTGAGHLLHPGLFWLPLLAAFTFADGSFSVCALYSTEIWPSRLRGSGAGLGGVAGSLGKIVGPLGLALVAGSNSVVAPSATAASVEPAFAFLALCLLACALTYLLIGVEARNRSIEEIDASLDLPAGEGAPELIANPPR